MNDIKSDNSDNNNIIELSEKKKYKLKKYAEKYKTNEKLLIAATARKTIRYIET